MKKLERNLGLGAILVIGLSSMLGTGMFVAPGVVYSSTGPSFILAFLLAGVLIFPAALSMSELAAAMPKSGGIYVYTDRTYGPLPGTIVGFGLWLSLLFKGAFALKGFEFYFGAFTDFPPLIASLMILALITGLNVMGVSKVASSLAYIVGGCLLSIAALGFGAAQEMSPEKMGVFFQNGTDGFMVALIIGVGAYAGLTKITAIAEEVQTPEKNLPKAVLTSLVLVMFIYGAIAAILSLSLDQDALAGNMKPLYTLASETFGGWGGVVLGSLAILALLAMTNAAVLAASRFPFAMSRDGLLPSLLGKVHPRLLTPMASIVLSGIVISLILVSLDVQKVAKLASVFIIQMFILVNLTVITLRESGVQWYQPKYRSPLYPFLHAIGAISGVGLLIFMGQMTAASLAMAGLPALAIYFFYGRKSERRGVVGIKGKRSDLLAEARIRPAMASIEDFKDARVVVPLFGRERSPETLTEMAFTLSEGRGVEVLSLTEVPEQTDLEDIKDCPAEKALERRIKVMGEERPGIAFDTLATHDLTKTLFEVGQRVHCAWFLLEWSEKSSGSMTFYNPVSWIKSHLDCHVAYFNDKGVRNVRKILVLIKGNDADSLVFHTAEILAKAYGAQVKAVFERRPGKEIDREKERAALQALTLSLKNSKQRVEVSELDYDKNVESIVELSVEFDLLIYGQDKASRMKKVFKGRDKAIQSQSACSVLRVSLGKNPVILN